MYIFLALGNGRETIVRREKKKNDTRHMRQEWRIFVIKYKIKILVIKYLL